MATRESRRDRGRRRGRRLKTDALEALRVARTVGGVSQRAMAREIGCSQAEYWRFESGAVVCDVIRLSEAAAILGLEMALSFHPVGDPIRDKGHQALLGRFRTLLSPAWSVAAERPLPMSGDLRSWDLLLRRGQHLVGVEAETRIRDIQALVRRMRQRERDGGTVEILVVLSDSSHNRGLIAQLREGLGDRYATLPRELLAALRGGRPLPGSGVVLL